MRWAASSRAIGWAPPAALTGYVAATSFLSVSITITWHGLGAATYARGRPASRTNASAAAGSLMSAFRALVFALITPSDCSAWATYTSCVFGLYRTLSQSSANLIVLTAL